jgi:tRNA(Ile)-lysidine synthase
VRAREAVRRQLKSAAQRVPDLFQPGTRLVVGYSGGQDSTCLLHALISSNLNLEIVAAHVDHGLRTNSGEDAQRVMALASALGARGEVRRVDVGEYRRGLPGWSVQQAARAARYQALAGVAHSYAAAAVMVGHTADDQAETFLINLLRGTGLGGLAAMRLDELLDPRRLGPPAPGLDSRGSELRLARPLLGVARSITQAYCAEIGLAVVEDASNQSRAYTRNRVRLDLLPALEEFNPAIRTVIARTAELASEDLAALDAQIAELHATLAHHQGDQIEYDLQLWRDQPRALQRRLLRRGLESLLGILVDVRAAPIDDALDLLQSGNPAQAYHLPYGVELSLQARAWRLRLHGQARPRTGANTWGVEVPRV